MKFRGLMIGAVLLAGLAAGLYFSNKQKSAEAAKPAISPDSPPKILALNEADITKISLQKKGADAIVLEKNDAGKWELTAPKKYLADQATVTQLVSSAASVNSDRLVEDKASDLAGYGLQSPNMEVDITTKAGKTSKLRIGDDTPTNSGAYAMLDGDPRLFTIASYTKTGLDKAVNDLRDKRLLTFDQDKLSRVELVAKKQDIEFGRDKDQWQIVKPKPLRADGLQVEELIRKLNDAKMDLTVSDENAKKAATAFASGTVVATVKFTDPSGTQQIEVRKSKDDYYAKSSAVEGVHKVAADLGTGLDKGVDDFRNKKLFDFGFSEPNKIEMHDGKQAYVFQKSGEDWTANGKKLDNIGIQSLIDRLRDFSASKFVDSGFTTASMDITVTSNDGKRVEKVLVAKNGSDFVAKRENEASLYALDTKTVDELSKAASDVKEAQAPAKKK
ncbi:MAG TPA: DUF4340 domain-containing protein [Bryobacteraceae bacterium]|nr:DUF4340 domain-containing protein [Bryobacteraceae bacterium]